MPMHILEARVFAQTPVWVVMIRRGGGGAERRLGRGASRVGSGRYYAYTETPDGRLIHQPLPGEPFTSRTAALAALDTWEQAQSTDAAHALIWNAYERIVDHSDAQTYCGYRRSGRSFALLRDTRIASVLIGALCYLEGDTDWRALRTADGRSIAEQLTR